jgi:hypothetical protein
MTIITRTQLTVIQEGEEGSVSIIKKKVLILDLYDADVRYVNLGRIESESQYWDGLLPAESSIPYPGRKFYVECDDIEVSHSLRMIEHEAAFEAGLTVRVVPTRQNGVRLRNPGPFEFFYNGRFMYHEPREEEDES